VEIASSRPQTLTEIVIDTQTEIKDLIKEAVFNVLVMITFTTRLKKLLDKNLAEIKDEEERKTCREALERYAIREYRITIDLLNLGNLPVILSFSAYTINEVNIKQLQANLTQRTQNLGIADVNKAFSQLGNSQAKLQAGDTLTAHAERMSRFEEQREMVDDLKEKTDLVICDTHSDCSDRCFQWQGRIYSLNHTSGTTEDGKPYVPLEVATDVYVATKSGKVWRNGLLGFNCRHKLVPYKTGMKPNRVSKKEQEKQQMLTERQRLYEREIRKAKDNARTFAIGQKNYSQFDRKTREYMQARAKKYRDKAISLTDEYEAFCRDNNRVIYRSRIKI